MNQERNDYDRIAADIDSIMYVFAGSTHEHWDKGGDSITITKEGFVKSIIRLVRLRNWVAGLAESHVQAKEPFKDEEGDSEWYRGTPTIEHAYELRERLVDAKKALIAAPVAKEALGRALDGHYYYDELLDYIDRVLQATREEKE